jgi:hypothetical protein
MEDLRMIEYNYGDFPTIEEIKRDYNELMEIIRSIRTIEQAKTLEKEKNLIIEINGLPIDEYVNGMKMFDGTRNDIKGTNEEIEWIRYENYGCLSYIYDRFDGKPMFDVWSEYCYDEFIRDITIDKLTEELYKKEKEYTINLYRG